MRNRYKVHKYTTEVGIHRWFIKDTEPTGHVYATGSTTTVARFITYDAAIAEAKALNGFRWCEAHNLTGCFGKEHAKRGSSAGKEVT